MKIAAYDIALSSQHKLTESDQTQESLRYWNNNTDQTRSTGQGQTTSMAQLVEQVKEDLLEISDAAKKLFAEQASPLAAADDEQGLFELSDEDKQKIMMIQDFIRTLTGKKVKFVIPQAVKLKVDSDAGRAILQLKNPQASQAQARQGWGLAYDFRQTHIEQEQTAFNAAGIVKTADGREINFSLDVAMSRQFMSEQSLSIRAGDALVDPLVVNFGGASASLSQTKYSFDLDADGTSDQISFVGPGSGFLALDKNGDGAINDGSELFGPQSGDGFADLAAYDSDGNQWIDENDPIYDKLRIWVKDETGKDTLFALGQKGIGAVYLGNVDTAFALKNNTNDLLGQIRTSSVYLREDGTAGTIQQVDLAV